MKQETEEKVILPKSKLQVIIGQESYALLEKICAQNNRSLTSQVKHWIQNERIR